MKNVIILIALAAGLTLSCNKVDDPVEENELTVTQQETDDLQFLIEEEKLARDVYLYSAALYNQKIFENIAASEQSHMDRIEALLVTYNLENPIAGKAEGEFVNEELQGLYNDLTTMSKASLVDALTVGATIEDLDIYDISELIENTEKADLLEAYTDLTCGSRNHIRSYTSQLNSNGENYVPQYISQELYDEILSGANEKCGAQ
jgi:hypothetical protein